VTISVVAITCIIIECAMCMPAAEFACNWTRAHDTLYDLRRKDYSLVKSH